MLQIYSNQRPLPQAPLRIILIFFPKKGCVNISLFGTFIYAVQRLLSGLGIAVFDP